MISLRAHEERVISEQLVLNAKLEALSGFVNTSPIYRSLPEAERVLLQRQEAIMIEYNEVLKERIKLFTL